MAKKRKRPQSKEETIDADDVDTEATPVDEALKPKTSVTAIHANEESTDVADELDASKKKRKKRERRNNTESQDSTAKAAAAPRFIVFIGNLPYTTTKSAVEAHFASVHPIAVRLNTFKSPGADGKTQCKGYGFLEFDSHETMKTCLKNFHHSAFSDGISPERKINVDLTAGGGGGKSQARKDKIQHKNERLSNQRQRAAQERLGERKERQLKGEEKHRDDIHPSRRRRIK